MGTPTEDAAVAAIKEKWPFITATVIQQGDTLAVSCTFGDFSFGCRNSSVEECMRDIQEWAMQRASDAQASTYEARKALKEWAADSDQKKAWLCGK